MTDLKVMLVEDDGCLREAIKDTLELVNMACVALGSAEEAVKFLSQSNVEEIGMVISDVNLVGMNGHELLVHIKKRYPNLPVLIMTAYGDITNAVAAMQMGAVDYLAKPFEPAILIDKVKRFILIPHEVMGQPIAEAKGSKELLNLAKRVATTDATVTILGPSGTGKEVLARYIHENSSRSDKPFVAINCAAIPDNMLEATLFGYEKGAFTGAYASAAGKFELAQGGTLLLDEISEMALPLQAKILRVLQEQEVERLGAKKAIKLDVRVVATSNRQLEAEVTAGRFREDLYYRLNVFPLKWLPLKDRREDIMPLAVHLLERVCQQENRVRPELSKGAREKLIAYDWPGNVREMSNIIQRALILQSGSEITAEDLHLEQITTTYQARKETVCVDKPTLGSDLKSTEQQIILQKLAENDGNRQKVAEALGISARTLRYKLAKMREQGLSV